MTTPAPPTAAILSIGDELARGQTLDTNSRWLADRLVNDGLDVVEHATVDDDERRIAAAIERLADACDVLIVTGGLGPTADDLTRFALARVLHGGPDADRAPMIEDAGALRELERWFADRGRSMPAANAVQALRPTGAEMIPNERGTAPGLGVMIDRLGTLVACLPGPPHELKPMFESWVVPRLPRPPGRCVGSRFLLTFGMGESGVAEALGDLMDRDRETRGLPLVGTTASRGVVTCRIRHAASDAATLASGLDETEARVRRALGAFVFDRRDSRSGDDVDLADALPTHVLSLCRDANAMIAVAESCTGGGLGEALTAVPGSSDVLFGGFITYANEAKSGFLGVPANLIERHGAVSAEVVTAMAFGALDRAASAQPRVRYALAVSGVAGPGGGTEDKPVGTVWIALAAPSQAEARRFQFRGGREAVRRWSALAAMGMLRQRLIDDDAHLLGEVDRCSTPRPAAPAP